MTDKDKKGKEVGLVFKVQGNEKDNHSGWTLNIYIYYQM